jgi:type IV secretory pathway TraG/TraD family ATPase VirD4
MTAQEAFPEHGINPLGAFEGAVSWLAATTTHVLLGVLIGVVIAQVMRMRHLHWSWAGCALLVVAVGRGVLGDWAWVALAALLTATVRGRRMHRREIESGGDLAASAATRLGPLDVLRSKVEGVVIARRTGEGAGGWFRGNELILGRDRMGRVASIPFGEDSGGTHALVVGATGSGKTVTQTWMVVQAIRRGQGAVVVDPKGDRAMRDDIAAAARAAGRQFIEWTPSGPSLYNPYARGSETEIADKVLAGERFTEPHYLRQAQRYLGHVIRALRGSGRQVTLREIVEHLDPERLESLLRTIDAQDVHAAHAYLDGLSAGQRSGLSGIRDRLAILAESDVGVWLDPSDPGTEAFDLLAAVRARAVVYFDLQADRRPLLTQMLGAAIVQDLLTTVAELQSSPVATVVVIDEFSAIAAEHVVRLFGRARSAGVSLVLGTQELSDLRPSGRERLLEQVMGNLSVVVAHRQVVPESATLVAELAGTRGAWRIVRHSDGRSTRTRTREGVLDASEVMSLPRGWAAVLVLSDSRRVCVVRVFSPRRER